MLLWIDKHLSEIYMFRSKVCRYQRGNQKL